MRKRLIIALVALFGAPLFACGAVGYYEAGYSNQGYVGEFCSAARDTSTVTITEPIDDVRKWALSAAFAYPFLMSGEVNQGDSWAADIALKRFFGLPVPFLSLSVELEISFNYLSGETESSRYSSYYGYYDDYDYFDGFNLDIYNNILARFTPLSFLFVETGIEWGFSVIDDMYGEEDDVYNNFFHFALPIGYGFRIANRFEIGERFYFGLDRYASHLGTMIRYQIIYVSVLF